METMVKESHRVRHTKVVIRGFIRGQLVNPETGKIDGDSGWVENSASNVGLTALAAWLGQQAGSSGINYGAMATQTAAFNMTQTDMVGRTASFASLNLSTSGTCTTTATVSFSSTMLSASCNVGAAGLYFASTGTGAQTNGLFCGQTFATSQWNTNQNFNLTYQIRFATA